LVFPLFKLEERKKCTVSGDRLQPNVCPLQPKPMPSRVSAFGRLRHADCIKQCPGSMAKRVGEPGLDLATRPLLPQNDFPAAILPQLRY